MPTKDKLNVAVVGFGKLGLLHAGLVNSLPNSRLCAVVDESGTVLDFLSERMPDVNVYKSHTDLLKKERPDAVVIATPTGSHIAIAMDFVNADVPIFLEKPLSQNSEQARPLLDLLDKKPIVNMVGYMSRYTATYVKAGKILETGILGSLQSFQATMYIGQLFKKGKGWRYDKATSGGGCLITQNSHLVDKLLWYFGDVECVSGHTRSLYSTHVEDSAHAYFYFKNGLTGFLDASWSKRHYRQVAMAISVQGENGDLKVNDDGVELFVVDPKSGFEKGWSKWTKPDLYEGVSFDIGGPYYTEQAESFLRAVREKSDVRSTIAKAYATQCVIDAIYESADNKGTPVYL